MTPSRSAGPVSDAVAALGYIFTKPRLIGTVAVAALVAYVFVCHAEAEWQRADPDGWTLMHPGMQVPQVIRCFVICSSGALVALIPLFVVIYIKRRIESSARGDR